MSEIPFVDRLGDALDAAIAERKPARPPRRSRRRRFGGLALAVFLLGAGGVTIAEILDDPEKLAAGPVACYDAASLEANVFVQSAQGREPVAKCAEVLRTRAALVACVRGDGVAVFPGPPQTCERLGLRPLPRGYAAASEKLARLTADVARITRARDCIPPARLARRIQRVLDRTGWRGWRAVDRPGQGPCGVAGMPLTLRAERREVLVVAGPPRWLDELLSTEGVTRLGAGARCLTVASLRAEARRRLAPARMPIRFVVERGPQPEHERFEPPARQQRFAEGCAIGNDVRAVYPRPGRIAIRVEIRVKR